MPLQNIETSSVINTLQAQGHCYQTDVLSETTVDQLMSEVDFDRIMVNHNTVGTVTSGTQRFFSHCLTSSKLAYDIITAPSVLDICDRYFTKPYQVTHQRFCQTRDTFHMPWHTDNNLVENKKLSGKYEMPGLLFLFYLSDENVSPFQYLAGSHEWSSNHSNEIFLSDRWIKKHHEDKVLTYKMAKGSLMVCDVHGIHRAVPFKKRNHNRTTLLFQVNQQDERYVGHGEQNLVNTAFIDQPSEKLLSYLGFGVHRDYAVFPNTSVDTMTLGDLLSLQQQVLPLTVRATAKSFVKALLPGETFIAMKRAAWKIRSSF